jgi:hypothetical protein
MLRMLLRAVLVAIGALFLVAPDASTQEGSEDGTLVAAVVFSPLRDWELQPARCTVHVFEDLREYVAPAELTDVADPRLPHVTSGRTGDQGRTIFSLPPGRYSVGRGDCDHWEEFAIANLEDPYYPYQCCQFFEGRPKPTKIYDDAGVWVITVQHIEVKAGELSTAYFEEWGEDSSASRLEWFLMLGIVVGAFAVVGVAAAILRPRYAPASDPLNPKRYEPPPEERDRRPATFDDIFGEFKRKD